MPLDLEQEEEKCDVINFGKGKGKVTLKVPGAVPFELMVEFYDLRNMDAAKVKTEDLRGVTKLIKEILYLVNPKDKVDNFVSSLKQKPLEKVITFIGNYMAGGTDSKKKDSKADSKK